MAIDGPPSRQNLDQMMPAGSRPDYDGLSAQIAAGDDLAFDALYLALFEPLVEFAYQYVRDVGVAEGIIHRPIIGP